MIRYYEELPIPLRLLVLLRCGRFVLAYERWRVSNTGSRPDET